MIVKKYLKGAVLVMLTLCKIKSDGFEYVAQPYKNISDYDTIELLMKKHYELKLNEDLSKLDYFASYYKNKFLNMNKGLKSNKDEYYLKLREMIISKSKELKTTNANYVASSLLLDTSFCEYFGIDKEYDYDNLLMWSNRFLIQNKTNSRNRVYRFKNKAYMNEWDYFTTFTYDDCLFYEKITGNQWRRKSKGKNRGKYKRSWKIGRNYCESHRIEIEDLFRKTLLKRLQYLHTAWGYNYMGVFERSEHDRLHFHGLLFCNNNMIGTIVEDKYFDTTDGKQGILRSCFVNTDFLKRFGRNDFQIIENELSLRKQIDYIIKYITKSGERAVYCRGLNNEEFALCDFEQFKIGKLRNSSYYAMSRSVNYIKVDEKSLKAKKLPPFLQKSSI